MNLLPYAEALGWTLVHSLWQGATVALLYALGKFLLRQKSPQSRYVLALGTLGIFSLGCMLTLILCWPEAVETLPAPSETLFYGTFQANEELPLNDLIPFDQAPMDWSIWMNPYLPYLTGAWVLGVLLMFLRFLGGWWQIQGLRNKGTGTVSESHQRFVHTWSERWGIRRPVKILSSQRVPSPVTLGFFKPVILIPVTLLTSLTPEQWEAILLHELAHIRRADYLIRMIQSMIEILFFYHPLIWWVGKDLAHEREACCDDQAVAASGNALGYATALTSLQRMCQPSNLKLAMAIQNRKPHPFTLRIHRIFDPQAAYQRPRAGLMMSLLIFLSLSALGYLHSQAQTKESPAPELAPISLTIDRSWTPSDLEEWIPRLAESGLDLHVEAYGLDVEGNLTSLVGFVTWSLGRTQDFEVKLGSIHFDYEPGKRLCMSVNDLRKNGGESLTDAQTAPIDPAQSSTDLDLRIDRSWTKDRLEASVSELAQQDIDLKLTSLDEDSSGQLINVAGNISFPDGISNSFDVRLGELHLARQGKQELKVTALSESEDMALSRQLIQRGEMINPGISPSRSLQSNNGTFVLVIDENWTQQELEHKIKELAESDIDLHIDVLATNDGHLSALVGHISFPDGESKGFAGKLGSLIINRSVGKRIGIKMSEATPKSDFKVIIDHSYTMSSLMNKVGELAKEGIGLVPNDMTVDDDGYLIALKGKVIFPNGNQANFIAEDMGEVIIESNNHTSISVTVRPANNPPLRKETRDLIHQQDQEKEAEASPLRQFSLGPKTTAAEWEALKQTLIEDGYEVEVKEIKFNPKAFSISCKFVGKTYGSVTGK